MISKNNTLLFLLCMAFTLFQSCDDDEILTMPPKDLDNCMVDTTAIQDSILLEDWKYLPGDTTWGVMSATRNDSILWRASMGVRKQVSHPDFPDDFLRLGATTFQETTGFLREHLSISEIPAHTIGTFNLERSPWNYNNDSIAIRLTTLQDDGDVVDVDYDLDLTYASNYLSIDYIDTMTNYYEGTFGAQLCLRPSGPNPPPAHSDTIRYEEGKFWFILIE